MSAFDKITQILEDIFGIIPEAVEMQDDLIDDWGITGEELDIFTGEFKAEFGVAHIPEETATISDYVRLTDRL